MTVSATVRSTTATTADVKPVVIPPALSIVELCRRFGTIVAVDNLSLDVARGEIVSVLGPSGCGKTTLLRLIAGFERPDFGTIEIGGVEVLGRDCFTPPEHRRVGMVFQDGALFPHLTVGQNVRFGLGRGDHTQRMSEVLELVGLADASERMPYELSGGQQQRVALARALAPRPEIILLDEPFSNLDAALRVKVRTEVQQILNDAHATAILVTHDQEEALSLADRVAVMWDGHILQAASPEELYLRPASKTIASFVGDAQFIPGESAGRTVRCALGDLPAIGAHDGPVDVMIRPEILRLAHDRVGSPATATVLTRSFYGHDQLLDLSLDNDCRVRARLGAYGGIRPGDRVHIEVRGAVLTFPRIENGSPDDD